MTTDRMIIKTLENAVEQSHSLISGVISLWHDLEKISKAIEHDDEARAVLAFRYNLDEHIEGIEGNRIVQRTARFNSTHKPESFLPTERERMNLTSLALALQKNSAEMGPEISLVVMQQILGYSFRLGYMKGWEERKK